MPWFCTATLAVPTKNELSSYYTLPIGICAVWKMAGNDDSSRVLWETESLAHHFLLLLLPQRIIAWTMPPLLRGGFMTSCTVSSPHRKVVHEAGAHCWHSKLLVIHVNVRDLLPGQVCSKAFCPLTWQSSYRRVLQRIFSILQPQSWKVATFWKQNMSISKAHLQVR